MVGRQQQRQLLPLNNRTARLAMTIGAKIPGAGSPGRLNFKGWRLIFGSHKCRTLAVTVQALDFAVCSREMGLFTYAVPLDRFS